MRNVILVDMESGNLSCSNINADENTIQLVCEFPKGVTGTCGFGIKQEFLSGVMYGETQGHGNFTETIDPSGTASTSVDIDKTLDVVMGDSKIILEAHKGSLSQTITIHSPTLKRYSDVRVILSAGALTLQGTVKTAAATVGDLTALKNQVNAMQSSVTSNSTNISSMKTDLAKAKTDAATASKAAGSLSSRLTNQEHLVGSLNTSMEKAQTQIAELSSQVDSLSKQGYDDTEIRKKISDAQGAIASLQKAVTDLQKVPAYDDSALKKQIQDLSSTVSGLGTLTDLVHSELGADKNAIGGRIKQELDNLNSSITMVSGLAGQLVQALEKKVDAVTEDVKTNTGNISKLQTQQTGTDGKVSALQKDVAALKAKPDPKPFDDSSLKKQITEINSQITGLSKQIDALSKQGYDDTAIQKKVADLQTALSSTSSTIASIQKSVTALKNKPGYDDSGIKKQLQSLSASVSALQKKLSDTGTAGLKDLLEAEVGTDKTKIGGLIGTKFDSVKKAMDSYVEDAQGFVALLHTYLGTEIGKIGGLVGQTLTQQSTKITSLTTEANANKAGVAAVKADVSNLQKELADFPVVSMIPRTAFAGESDAFFARTGSIVAVNLVKTITAKGAGWQHLVTLPDGMNVRPPFSFDTMAANNKATNDPIQCRVNKDGTINAYAAKAGTYQIMLSMSFCV